MPFGFLHGATIVLNLPNRRNSMGAPVPNETVSRVGPLTLGKCVSGAVNAALLTLLPLAFNLPRLEHPIPWLAFAASAVILATQPPLKLKEMLSTTAEGRSGLGIMASAVLVTAAPIVDFGYRRELAPALDSAWFVGGVAVLVLGVWLRLWAIAALGPFFTAVVAVQPGQTVVQRGPYRFIRHPSYAGALLAALGGALLCRSLVAGVLTLLTMVPAYLYRIAREEAWLTAQLGEPYARYR